MKSMYDLENPCEKAIRPKVAKKRRRYFNPEELARIIKNCRFEQDTLLILTLIDSAARIGEIAGLRAGDVGESWINVEGKTGQRRYRLEPYMCRKLKEAADKNGVIFRGASGGPATVQSLKYRVRRVIKEAGITGKKLGPHTLRHSGASLVAQETGSALAVKALLQHDDIHTSMGYIHDVEDVIQQRISPLALVGEKVVGEGFREVYNEPKQLTLGRDDPTDNDGYINNDGVDAVVGECELVGNDREMYEEMFPVVKDGVSVRPLLKTEDLRLIREVFIEYIILTDGSHEIMLRDMMRRVLRKVKN